MCWRAGKTFFYTCSCGHGGLEIAKPGVLAILVDIPPVLLVELVYVIGPASDPLDASPYHGGQPGGPICSCFLAAFWAFFGLATCSFGMVTGSWCLQQHMAMEKMSTNGNVGSLAYHQPQALEQLQQG